MIFQIDLITLTTLALLGLAALAALAVLLADSERLPRLVRSGMDEVLGAERMRELLDLQHAWERQVLSQTQLTALRILGGTLGALLALALLLARQPAGAALALGLAAGGLGVLYPGLRFQRGLARQQVKAAEEHVIGFIAHLRQEAALGSPIEQAIRIYVETQHNPLADLFAGMPLGTGSDPIAGVCEVALRAESPVLLPVASSLPSLRDARDVGPVLRSMEERARLMLVARIDKENAAKRLQALLLSVGLILLSLLALILVPILLRIATVQGL